MGFYRSWIGGGGELVRRYTSSLQDDVEIAEEVVKVMEAHVKSPRRGRLPCRGGG
jgi:argininosuccinate lyase (EC 4.3.2.1)